MHLFVSYIPFSKVDIVHRVTMERFGYSWKCRLVSLLSESLYTLIIVKCNNMNEIYWYFVVSKYNEVTPQLTVSVHSTVLESLEIPDLEEMIII